ncbi:hypothetical protein ACVUOP_000347, partial [Klebsiella oxytoca]
IFYNKVDNIDVIKTMKAITNRNGAACCRSGKFLFSSQASTNSYPELFTIVRGACRVSIRPLTL